jgi:5-methylcytosine-specific restriction endonuclease McrA
MQKHIKNFYKHYNLAPDDWIECQVCGGTAVDIHHIVYKSHGGSDDVSNLIALCRNCHNKAHKLETPYLEKDDLLEIIKNILTKL